MARRVDNRRQIWTIAMRIATYNVNGINGRLANLLGWPEEAAPGQSFVYRSSRRPMTNSPGPRSAPPATARCGMVRELERRGDPRPRR